jgi:cyclopropane fatty-acyl-phospholipid synthase-like methyltransferase
MCYITDDPKEYQVDHALADKLIVFFRRRKATRVVDLGCGSGYYVNRLIAAGFDAVGYDLNPYSPQLSEGSCRVRDLSYPVALGQFDWVLSLETGEHITESRERFFFDNIDRAASIGAVLSWAIPGQTGVGHVNERTNEYVIDRMTRRGFKHNTVAALSMRRVSTLAWFKNTIMIFERV